MAYVYDLLVSPTTSIDDGTIVVNGATEQQTMQFLHAAGAGTWRGWARTRDTVTGGVSAWLGPTDPIVIGGGGSATRLGLHTTAEELTIWRDRWANGVTGDTFLNDRITDEKSRITGNKNTYMTDPAGHLFTWTLTAGTSTCIVQDGVSPNSSSWRPISARIRDAAYYALINQDATIMAQVGATLAAQPDQANMDFTASPPYCTDATGMRNAADPGFAIAHMMVTHLHAYDYFRIAVGEGWATDLSQADKDKIGAWHAGFAGWVEPSNTWRANWGFVDRLNDIYDLNANGSNTTDPWTTDSYRNSGGTIIGPTIHRIANTYNNRDASIARYLMLYGCAFDSAFYRDRAWRWVRDSVRYTVYPHGILSDWHRHDNWTGYSTLHMTHILSAADAHARFAGDTNLYDLSTTMGAHDSEGAPLAPATDPGKSLKFLVESVVRHAKGAYSTARYAWGSTGNLPHVMDYRQSRDFLNRGFHDRMLQANLYYQNAEVIDWYRGQNGVHPWTVTGNGTTDLNDAWAFPAPYLMWAGLEGQVNPYSVGA